CPDMSAAGNGVFSLGQFVRFKQPNLIYRNLVFFLAQRQRPPPLPALFATVLFLSAALLFWLQPMIAKMVVHLLGGTPAVWNTCMVFFQAALLAGYAYAHVTTAWLGVRRQVVLHTVLI